MRALARPFALLAALTLLAAPLAGCVAPQTQHAGPAMSAPGTAAPGLGVALLALAAGALAFGTIVDRRIEANVYEDGSSLWQVGMTEDQAQAVGALAGYTSGQIDALTAGWYIIANMEGGTLADNITAEDIEDEAGNFVKRVTTLDEKVLTNTAFQTDDFTIALLKYMLTHALPGRLPLPTNNAGDMQWRFYPGLKTREIGALPTAKGVRKQPFVLVGKKIAGVGPEIGPVTLVTSQADTKWAPYAAYKDAAFAAA